MRIGIAKVRVDSQLHLKHEQLSGLTGRAANGSFSGTASFRLLRFVSMKEGAWSSGVGSRWLGPSAGVVVASSAQVSIAPSVSGTVRNGRFAPVAHFQREPSGG